jgi:hypothetical protein
MLWTPILSKSGLAHPSLFRPRHGHPQFFTVGPARLASREKNGIRKTFHTACSITVRRRSRLKIKGMVAFALMLTAFAGIGRTAQAQTTPQADAAALDHLIHAAWQQKGIVPAKPVDDARYLRRIYLDITGTIPPEQVVSEFLSDRSPNKRAKAVDALLDSSAYADHWATYWDNVLMGKPAPMATVDYGAFRRWLHGEFAQNTPYNRFVADLITASGFNTTGVTYAESMGYGMAQPAAAADPDRPKIDPATVNGAVNWHLRFAANPADVAGIASKIFLGVQIQCAQCHDHKTEKWKQADFRSFTTCFIQTVGIPTQRYTPGQAMKGIVPLNVRDVNFIVRGNKMNGGDERLPYVEATPVALDGTPINVARTDRRKELAAWMTSPQNPWFAQAIVNRMWAKFLGRGFVEPIDDFRPSNPAVLPEAMQILAKDFAAHNYDLKTLIKTICASDVYQRSSVPAASKADPENTLWDHYRLKPDGGQRDRQFAHHGDELPACPESRRRGQCRPAHLTSAAPADLHVHDRRARIRTEGFRGNDSPGAPAAEQRTDQRHRLPHPRLCPRGRAGDAGRRRGEDHLALSAHPLASSHCGRDRPLDRIPRHAA